MKLGLFLMPLHKPEKPWKQTLREDREAVIQADRLGLSEVWIGEHFSTKSEQIPSAMMFLASLIDATKQIRFGTGVINLPHHNPILVAAEAAMFDQLCDGRLILGIGPGGLASDAELFAHEDMGERNRIAMDSLDAILRLWQEQAPIRIDGEHWKFSLEKQVWPHGGVGTFPRPMQTPHPPIAMAMVSPGGQTIETIAERDFIPISANFVSVDTLEAQWTAYAAVRDRLNKPTDPAIWRVCRNILVTESEQRAQDALSDPDGTLAYYFRYLRGIRRIAELNELGDDTSPAELNEFLGVDEAIAQCVIAGTSEQVLERLTALVDRVGPFGNLIMVGHDLDQSNLWQSSMERLVADVMPKLAQYAASVGR
jgi:alkanesulfonate monooxygenase SsuD/methylene tetrahydromethanopterin reductase-like flavin-dependent oxidoreductase (luciferase family)